MAVISFKWCVGIILCQYISNAKFHWNLKKWHFVVLNSKQNYFLIFCFWHPHFCGIGVQFGLWDILWSLHFLSLFEVVGKVHGISWNMQGSSWVSTQTMRDDVTLQRLPSLAEPIPRMIPDIWFMMQVSCFWLTKDLPSVLLIIYLTFECTVATLCAVKKERLQTYMYILLWMITFI